MPSGNNLVELIDRLDPVFDEAIVDGNDDELFASGYLRGHFDLVAARLILAGESETEALWPALEQAIDNASHELTPADQTHVKNLYQKLQQRAATSS
ncbi:hypothetical protein CWE09_00175 [Aliidiomarina minuta]|uniref:YfcL family protein n=1 Tax=Aliidiomarina minuta TaxID=880057 RepID=A0A432W5E7_9GAMM|nr:YfcL family protein [Aliidiomarina minuta]RUO25199.1 hypothetical protein CWE09_00175 [Aliidiomarina minuta]